MTHWTLGIIGGSGLYELDGLTIWAGTIFNGGGQALQ